MDEYAHRWNSGDDLRQIRAELAAESLPACGERIRDLAGQYMDLAIEQQQAGSEEKRDALEVRLRDVLDEYLVEGAAMQGKRIPRVVR
jgi:hypothetical protein